jgi:hypothetical protein
VTEASSPPSPSRAFGRACVIGGVLGTILFAWLLTRGTFDFLEWQRVGDFYDAQAHAFLDGRLAVDGRRLGVEAFTIDGNAYMYQGPVPALLRLPVVAVAGHDLDGRLTQLSMLGAFAVAVVFACRIHWKVRRRLRGDDPVTRTEAWLVGLFTFVLAGGSALLYEASRAWVYHEALLWGTALALAAIDTMVSFVARPSVRTLVACSALAAGALLTRASIGVGPVVGLVLLALGSIAVMLRDRVRPARFLAWMAPGAGTEPAPASSARFPAWITAAAAAAPLALYAVVNYAKFDRLFSVPFYAQEFSKLDPGRQRFLAENGGTLFGIKFVPTTVLQYLRPDALRFTGTFPFVEFPHFPGPIIGDVRFDLFDRASSVPASLPFLFVLAVAGIVVFLRSLRGRPELADTRVPFVAAAACAATILPFGYIANRYLADFLPLLVFAGAFGLQAVVRRLASSDRPAWVRPAAIALVPLAAFTIWVNLGLALRYQREYSYNLDAAVVAGFVGFQHDLGGNLDVERGDSLPGGVRAPGRLFVVGDCDGLYLSDGLEVNAFKTSTWNAVERTERAGHFVADVVFPPRPPGTRVPIFSNGSGDDPNLLVAEYADDESILFEYREPESDFAHRYVPFPIEYGREYTLDIAADANVSLLTVRLDDVVMLDAAYEHEGRDFRLGRSSGAPGVAARFPGRFRVALTGAPLCRALLRDAA